MPFAFYARSLEQLDVAREHIALGDPNNARFGLMLVDNVVELTLHKIAEDQHRDIQSFFHQQESYPHVDALQEAMGRRFDKKVKFAKLAGVLSDEKAESLNIFHEYRNEVYHIGLRHEEILLQLAKFSFDTACWLLRAYDPRGFGWSSDDTVPERTRRFFKADKSRRPGSLDESRAACLTLASENGFDADELVAAVANHMSRVIEAQDKSIGFLAEANPTPTTRDRAIVESQTWPLAWSEKGKKLVTEAGFQPKGMDDLLQWLEANGKLTEVRDPIPSWRKRVALLRTETDPHKALRKYNDFMAQTETVRTNIDDAHTLLDQEIDRQIDAARERR